MALNPFADGLNNNYSTFIVKNNSRKTVSVMGVRIAPGANYNLMSLEGITEEDIKVSLLKGVLKRKLNLGEISIISTDIDLTSLNLSQQAFLNNNNILKSFKLTPRGGGLDDGPNFASALLTASENNETLILSGEFTFNSTSYANGILSGIPSNTHLYCEPGTKFTSTLTASGGVYRQDVPFLAIWLDGPGTYDTTLHLNNTLGSNIINATASIPNNSWIMLGDASLSSCGVYKVISSAAGGGGFNLTLDRPVVLAQIAGAAIKVLADIPQNIILDFNGATLSGTGLQACVILGGRNCYVKGLRVDTSVNNFEQYNGPHFNDGCFNCHAIDCIADGGGTAGTFSGPHIANSEACTFQRMACSRFPALGISFAGTIGCSIVDATVDNCLGTGIYISELAGVTNNSRDTSITRARITRCTDGIGIDANVKNTKINDSLFEDQTAYGIRVYTGALGVSINNICTRRCGSYGARIDSDALIYKWLSDSCITGSLLATNASSIIVDGFAWGQNEAVKPPYGAVHTSTGRIILKNGKSTVNASGGSATTYAAAACTFVRENVITSGRGGHYSDAVNSMLIDHSGNDDSACTVANVFGGASQANYGTVVANGSTPVAISYRGMKTSSIISFTLSVVSGTPAGSPYLSAITPGTGFSIKVAVGDTSTYSWKDISA